MGTTWSVHAVLADHGDVPALAKAVQDRLDRVVAEMSQWEAGSHLSRFNAAAPGSWHNLPLGFACVLEEGLEVARLTGGAFDPTIGPASEAWGFGARQIAALPDEAEILSCRQSIGWRIVDYIKQERRLLQPGNLVLDFSAIAKGYGVDQMAEALLSAGISSFLVEVGGELRGAGLRPDRMPWWVEVETPQALPPLRIALSGWAVATSGKARRYHQAGSERIGHTIAPDRGVPVHNAIDAVTVLDRSTMRADALATALMVMGDAAAAFADEHDIAARIIMCRNGDVYEELSLAFKRAINDHE